MRDVAKKLNSIEKSINRYYPERETAIHSVALGLLTNQNVIMVGPPGTAKTAISEAWAMHMKDAKHYGATLTPYTTPDEVFGPPKFSAIKNDDLMIRNVEGYLPSAHFVTVEEIFKAGKGFLNSCLEITHPKRLFTNGPEQIKTPILTVIGTSNELPLNEKGLDALYDRMMLKVYVSNITDNDNLTNVLKGDDEYTPSRARLSLDEIYTGRKEVKAVKMSDACIATLVGVREELYKKGIFPSDRTLMQSIKTVKAEAYLNGRDEVEDMDLRILCHALWKSPDEEAKVWKTIIEKVAPELERMSEILGRCEKAFTEVMAKKDEEHFQEKYDTLRQIQGYISEGKEVRYQMLKNKRNVVDCDNILRKLDRYVADLSMDIISNKDDDLGDLEQ